MVRRTTGTFYLFNLLIKIIYYWFPHRYRIQSRLFTVLSFLLACLCPSFPQRFYSSFLLPLFLSFILPSFVPSFPLFFHSSVFLLCFILFFLPFPLPILSSLLFVLFLLSPFFHPYSCFPSYLIWAQKINNYFIFKMNTHTVCNIGIIESGYCVKERYEFSPQKSVTHLLFLTKSIGFG